MKKYDGKAVSATLSEEMKQAGQEYPYLEQVYMKVFGKPLPESRKPTIKENGREIYYPASASTSASNDDNDDDNSCYQNKEWFQRVFYTDYNCTSKYGKEWQAKRGERLREYLDEHDACIRCKGSQS